MSRNALGALFAESEQTRPKNMEELLGSARLLLPMLDAIPNAVIFIKDTQARYLLANRTLVQRCGLKDLHPLLGKTSAEVFPAQLGPGYTEQDRCVLQQGQMLEDQLELHLYGSREPGWCLTHKRPLQIAADASSGWWASPWTCSRPVPAIPPTSAWPPWTNTFASISTKPSPWRL